LLSADTTTSTLLAAVARGIPAEIAAAAAEVTLGPIADRGRKGPAHKRLIHNLGGLFPCTACRNR